MTKTNKEKEYKLARENCMRMQAFLSLLETGCVFTLLCQKEVFKMSLVFESRYQQNRQLPLTSTTFDQRGPHSY